eukprot:Nitzschia sp. Nitz4//scaffold129_size63868//41950//45266//NITZ4_006201-RA/size63868-augustus-gene-0.53-mRNA-1//1//CDS//3329534911//1790//frame0
MFTPMDQPLPRRPQSSSRSASTSRPATYEKVPMTGVSRSKPGNHSNAPPTDKRKRSTSAQRTPTYQVYSTHHHPQHHSGRSSFNSHTFPRPEDFDGASVSSAPSMTKHNQHREFREPLSSRSVQKPGKAFRDESPVGQRSYSIDTPQKHIKNARKIIEELHRSVESGVKERRAISITNTCADFDHMDDKRHNVELQKGAATVLSKMLSSSQDEDEMRMVCAALEMVFRAQPSYVHVAFDKCGSVMMPHLLRLLERAENGDMKQADVTTLNISKVLLYISRVPDLRMHLAHNKGMMAALKRLSSSILSPECRVVRIRIVANLVNCDDNKAYLLEHKELVSALLRIAHLDLSDVAREYASVAMMDLASAPANQVPMAKNEKLLGTLVKMVLVEKLAPIRESAITAIQNLAFTKENRTRLVSFKSGIVLEALKKALSGDSNDKARRRAAGALTNLACDETAEIMGNHKGLLDTLALVSTRDNNEEVQTRAAMALTKLAASISIKMASYSTLLDALVVASLSPAANSVSAVLRVKARDPENRESMARHPGILDTLADICTSRACGVKDQDNAMRAIMHLTNENSNRKVMCTERILDALVQGTHLEDPNMWEMRDSAVRSLERLATEFSNRAVMANHDGLLVGIAKATEREAKLEAQGVKTEHALLAKPLHDHQHHRSDWKQRGYTVGIGGPVGSGKTALVLALTKRLSEKVPLGVVTNDIFTQEDAEFLTRNEALPPELIRAVETGGCPHAAIREDVSANLTACEELTQVLQQQTPAESALILCESGGDNLAANFSRELADLTLYVIDVAGGDKVPRKGGPGITQSDLLVINKIDLAEAVGADLGVMKRDADKMRSASAEGVVGPTVFASVKKGTCLDDIEQYILDQYEHATKPHEH